MKNINTQSFWDRRWSTDGMLSRKCEKAIMKLVDANLSVLDVGCGTGRILRGLRKDKGCRVFGVDISLVAIYVLSRYGIEGRAGDAKNLPSIKKKFDVVICSHTLEHITDDKKLIRDIAAKTKKYAIIAVPNDAIGPEECEEHLRKYTKESLSGMLLKHFSRVEDHSVGIHLILKAYA